MKNSNSMAYEACFTFDAMIRHCDIAKRGLDAELKLLEDIMDRDLEGADSNFEDYYHREINDFWIETAQTIPRLQWYSQFLISYGFLEKSLNDICFAIQRETKSPLGLKDLSGQGISRARNYLVKVAGISKVFQSEHWQSIKLLAEVRNVVAHKDGLVSYEPKNHSSLFYKLSKVELLTLEQEYIDQSEVQIMFDQFYVVKSIELYRQFILDLVQELKKQN
ncbi:hypothetical protein BCT42_14570 [Vibrio lentus]|nr:hypothetical protein [Vibrio coralliirubri]PML43439.1 hypothetical protein BCT75_06145 [Vibrio lentus]PMN04836.1 hypothetical protein BCT42_14570 [Vibrio lentus]CDT85891.1 hypothetical protein VCR8J2_240468 [Vibrio coralliirubri]